MSSNEIRRADLKAADKGSWYTIAGAGGDLHEWIDGYSGLLTKEGIGKPAAWYYSTGDAVNKYAHPADERDEFKEDLTFLMFPLDGLNVGKLALFKLRMQDRWFDDVVANMRHPLRGTW